MKLLHLLRHAKSAWDDAGLADHDRPLAPRGARAATLMGRHLARQDFRTDLVLCSTARRAVDTATIVLAQLEGPAPPLEREAGLYLCGDRALLDRLRSLPEAVGSVLLVAHNPDLQNLTLALAGSAAPGLLERVAEKFPTGGLASLSFGIESWADLAPGAGRLEEFAIPKNLT
ncbi:SixA phosphatase family protein [Arenibaculum pallidiluteum]|uniref:SixA phosphatase family protein n=1 Tax=Arenibaculum pallidiluteum TaxID=2812559 RepID=UPI001A96AC31|nr:histidine phosphatase family protein [Arenibaculum pallidiluteum]